LKLVYISKVSTIVVTSPMNKNRHILDIKIGIKDEMGRVNLDSLTVKIDFELFKPRRQRFKNKPV